MRRPQAKPEEPEGSPPRHCASACSGNRRRPKNARGRRARGKPEKAGFCSAIRRPFPEAVTPRKPEPRPEQKQGQNREQKPKRPAIGQIISRPGDAARQPAKPVGLAPNVIRAPQPGSSPSGRAPSARQRALALVSGRRPAEHGRPASPAGYLWASGRRRAAGVLWPSRRRSSRAVSADRPTGSPGARRQPSQGGAAESRRRRI